MNNFKLSKYKVITEPIDETGNRLLYSTKTNEVITISNIQFQNLLNENFNKLNDKELLKFLQMGLIVPNHINELNEILEENEVLRNSTKTLYHVIQPTADCQLGCNYCGQVHYSKKMSPELYDKIINRIEEKVIANREYNALSITWYGAEPLLALKQIKDLTPKLKSLSKKYNLKYSHDMITNGLLLKKDIFEMLVDEYEMESFQITIDGLANDHDKRRMTKRNTPTFNIIMNNIKNAINSDSYKKGGLINLRINIDKNNEDSVLPLIEFLDKEKILKKIVIDFAEIVDWGDNKASKNSLSIEEFATKEIDWILELIKRDSNIGGLLPDRVGATCMVETEDAEVYDANGNVLPCYEMSYTPKYEDTVYFEANLNDKDVEYNKTNPLRKWHKYVKDGIDNECDKCIFYPVCGGGCPKSWLIDKKPSCPSFRYNIHDRLVLHYLKQKSNIKSLL